MNYKLKHSGLAVTITERDFVAEGGEGKVYAKGGTAYKIGSPIPEGKIIELSAIHEKNVLTPNDIILSGTKAVGYTMPFIEHSDCHQLPLLFTNTFWARESITTDKMLKLVQTFRDTVEAVHKAGVLIVDLNEYNFLAKRNLSSIYFIDTNSYQTKSYPATAIMDSIRDVQSKVFSENTDWYSFGIISFQMLIGVHPFRTGNYDKIQGSVDERMIARMAQNVSVLNPKVKFPKNACRPFSTLPANYMGWYKAVFEEGKRLPFPLDATSIIVIAPTTVNIVTDCLTILKLDNWHPKTKQTIPQNITGMKIKQVIEVNGEIYFQSGPRLYRAVKTNMLIKSQYVSTEVASVMENATFFGDNCIFQNMAGTNYNIILDKTSCKQVRVRELDFHTILTAINRGHDTVVISKLKNVIFKTHITYDEDFENYTVRTETGLDFYQPQAILLDTGLFVHTGPEGELIVSKGIHSKIVKDKFLEDDYELHTNGYKVILKKNNEYFQIEMK